MYLIKGDIMIQGINSLLESNDIQVRIGSEWYRLDSISIEEGEIENTMPIVVSNEEGQFEGAFDMADVDEFDPMFRVFKDMDMNNVGVA